MRKTKPCLAIRYPSLFTPSGTHPSCLSVHQRPRKSTFTDTEIDSQNEPQYSLLASLTQPRAQHGANCTPATGIVLDNKVLNFDACFRSNGFNQCHTLCVRRVPLICIFFEDYALRKESIAKQGEKKQLEKRGQAA